MLEARKADCSAIYAPFVWRSTPSAKFCHQLNSRAHVL